MTQEHLVSLVAPLVHKVPSARPAHERLHAHVDPLVDVEVPLLREALPARGAHKGPLPSVGPLMTGEAGPVVGGVGAEGAPVLAFLAEAWHPPPAARWELGCEPQRTGVAFGAEGAVRRMEEHAVWLCRRKTGTKSAR